MIIILKLVRARDETQAYSTVDTSNHRGLTNDKQCMSFERALEITVKQFPQFKNTHTLILG